MRSQLKRVDGEVTALSQRIKALDENLAKSEQYIKTATAALADAVAMEVERRKNSSNCELEEEDANNPLSQFDAQMSILEGKLLEAKYLASKVSSNTPTSISSQNSPTEDVKISKISEIEDKPQISAKNSPAKSTADKPPQKLRRPFPVP